MQQKITRIRTEMKENECQKESEEEKRNRAKRSGGRGTKKKMASLL